MKAYQMRITLEDSKPAIYRQCIIPAGITFSQFALVLNKVMGWKNEHLFSFQFPDMRMEEKYEENDLEDLKHPVLEASNTYVDEYLEKNALFMYLYDFGDNWEHRVEIEAVLDPYEFTYPQVLKYKGACPIEDCGGIPGYYHMMEVLKNHNHPDYEETLEWALSMGYTNTYSQKRTNAELMEYYFVKEGKGDNRHFVDLLQDLAKKKGLKASKNPKNRKRSPTVSTSSKAKKPCNTIADERSDQDLNAIREEGYPIKCNHVSLKDIIKRMPKTDLAQFADMLLDIPAKSLKKNELVQKITERLLEPEYMYHCMLTFNDESMALFQKIIDAGNAYMPSLEDLGIGQWLLASGYVSMRSDEGFEIADDIAKVFQSIASPEFHSKRKQTSWLLQCLSFAQMYYGACPLKVLVKLYNKGKGLKTTQKDLLVMLETLPITPVVKIGDLYVDYYLAEDHSYEKLLEKQGDIDYYIPTREQIADITTPYYLLQEETLNQFSQFLMEHNAANTFGVLDAVAQIQMMISLGAEMEEALTYLEEQEITIPKSKKKKLAQLLNAVYQNTRMLKLRGYTRSEKNL